VAPHASTLVSAIKTACCDPTLELIDILERTKVILHLQDFLQESEAVLQLKPLIQHMMDLSFRLAAEGYDEDTMGVLEFFQMAADVQYPLLDGSHETVIRHIVTLITDCHLSYDICREACVILVSLVEKKGNLFHLPQPVMMELLTSFKLSAVEVKYASGERLNEVIRKGGTGEFVEEDALRDRHIVYAYVLLKLSENIPARFLLESAADMFWSCSSCNDVDERRFGCDVLAWTAKDLCESLRPQFEKLVPAILERLADNAAIVREGALYMLSRFALYGWPEIFYHHATILPALCTALGEEANIYVQAEACKAAELFCSKLNRESLRPHLQQLLFLLGNILTCVKPTVASMSLLAIGSVATAAKEEFLPYVDAILTFLEPLLFDSEPTHSEIRVEALIVMGKVATAVGKETFAPHFATGLRSVFEDFVSKNPRLLRYRFGYYRDTVNTMGEDMAAYFPQILPDLLAILVKPEPQPASVVSRAFVAEDEGEQQETVENTGGSGESTSLPQKETKRQKLYFATKVSAIFAIGEIAEHAPRSFYGQLDEFVDAMVAGNLFEHRHSQIGQAAHRILGHFVKCIASANGISANLEPGQLVTLSQPDMDRLGRYALFCLNTITNRTDKVPVIGASYAVAAMLEVLGRTVLELPVQNTTVGLTLLAQITLVLQEKASCQTKPATDTGEEEDLQFHLISSAFELVSESAKAMGPSFSVHLDELLPHILKYTDSRRSEAERWLSIGCFGDCFHVMGPVCVRYATPIMKVVCDGLKDDSSVNAVRRNSAFAIGMLVKATGAQLAHHFGELLQWLAPVCTRPADQGYNADGADTDNALSAACHIIRASPDSVPLSEVLPVILAALPVRADFSEGINIYRCLFELLLANNPVAILHVTSILSLYGQELTLDSRRTSLDSNECEDDKVDPKELITEQLKSLGSSSTTMREILLTASQSMQDEHARASVRRILVDT
jgi:hypothetical protein